jgi:hypothetical protein
MRPGFLPLMTSLQSRASRGLALGFLATVLSTSAGCGGPGDTTAPLVVAHVVVTPSAHTLFVGQSVTLAAAVTTSSGTPITGQVITWTSADTEIASVQNGVVTALRPGTVNIVATTGGVSGTSVITVQAVPVRTVAVSPSVDSLLTPQVRQLTATARDSAGNVLTGRAVTWQSSDTLVAHVSAGGLVTARAAGTVTISAAVEGVVGTTSVRVIQNPVRPTSYENFKQAGVTPLSIPLPSHQNWGYTDVIARGYGDFFRRGTKDDLFTARIVYSTSQTQSAAPPAVYTFWRRESGTYVEHNSRLRRPACILGRRW